MNSYQLYDAMKMDRLGKQLFLGVYAADELKNVTIKKYPCGLIANTDISSKPGAHWVAFLFKEDETGEFFCSYGKPPGTYDFEKWIGRNAKSWNYNKTRLQGDLSSVCGQYCLFWLLHSFRKLPIVQVFGKDFTINDTLVNSYVQERFNINTSIMDTQFLKRQIARAINGRF